MLQRNFMREGYIIGPKNQKLLNDTGIAERIETARRDDKLYSMGALFYHEIPGYTRELVQEGFFKELPEAEAKPFMKSLQDIFLEPDKRSWKINRNGNDTLEALEEEDFLTMTGWFASYVLSSTDVGNYSKFGFESLQDFLGTVGAAVYEQNGLFRPGERGFVWESFGSQGESFVNEVGGDINCDLRIYRTDTTPYPSKDPTGNKVGYRPIGAQDRQNVYAYHSTEPTLLVALLQHIHHLGMESELLKDGARDLISRVTESATCAEHLSPGYGDLRVNFFGFDEPLPKLTERKPGDLSLRNLYTNHGGAYGIYQGNNGELIFVYHPYKSPENVRIDATFLPKDLDPMLESLMRQAASNLGRTSVEILSRMLEYRFSEQFEKDQAEEARRLNS